MKSNKRVKYSVLPVILFGMMSTVQADDVNCPPDLGTVTIDGNVLVAAPCRLDGTTVKGNVLLYAGGSLIARNANIDGNIQAENADFVDVADSHVEGSIQLDDLVGDVVSIDSNSINGSIQLKGNRPRLQVRDNTVGADIQAFDNTGGVVVEDNIVDGNLQCKSNTPPPVGGNNRVSGNKEDQCENLSPDGDNGALPSNSGPSNETSADAVGGGSFGPMALLWLTVLLWAARRRIA